MAYSHIFGIRAGALTLRPGMTLSQDDKGHWTGRAEFTCLSGDFGTTQIQLALRKGTSLSQVSDQVGVEFSFLALETVTARDEPGGYTVIEVTYKGYNEEQWEFDSDLSKVYTRNSALQEYSILNHPQVALLTWTYQQALRMGIEGKWTEREDSTDTDLKLVANGNPLLRPVFSTTDAGFIEWWVYVIRKGNHTYKVAASEWTVATTGKAKLQSTDLAKLGKIDTPDGEPATPPGENWMLTGITENIQVSGEGSNSWSKTWTSSGPEEFPEKIYGEPAP